MNWCVEQHPELNISVMDVITKLDPSKTYKYTEFLVKKFKEFYDEYDDWGKKRKICGTYEIVEY